MASIITAFFFLLIMFIGHEKPLNYKRGKLKTFGAWLLVALSLADMALAGCIALKVMLGQIIKCFLLDIKDNPIYTIITIATLALYTIMLLYQ